MKEMKDDEGPQETTMEEMRQEDERDKMTLEGSPKIYTRPPSHFAPQAPPLGRDDDAPASTIDPNDPAPAMRPTRSTTQSDGHPVITRPASRRPHRGLCGLAAACIAAAGGLI